MTGTRAFWPSNNMKTSVNRFLDRRELEKTPERQRIFRAIYQAKIEHGKFKGETIEEYKVRGAIFVNSTNESDPEYQEIWNYSDVQLAGPPRVLKKEKERDVQGFGKFASKKTDEAVKQEMLADLVEPDDSKPPMTNKHWPGTYFSWYKHFIVPEFPNPKPMGEIHEDWEDEIESDEKVIMVKPRDHYKTTFISVGYAVYNICEQKLYPILIISLSDKNTKDVFAAIKQHLTKNPRILEYYGYLLNDDRPITQSKCSLKYQKSLIDPGIFCATFGSKVVMGTHPKLAILDDIQDRPLTPAFMQQAKQLIEASLIPAVGTDGKIIIIGTIKGWNSANDIYLYCKKKGVFSYYADPAIYMVDENGDKLLDENGDLIHDMPPMDDVKWERKMIPRLNEDGTIKKYIYGRHKGKVMRKMDFIIELTKEEDRYKSIFPEAYSVKDIIRKRIELHDTDMESDDKFWSEYFLRPTDPKGKFFDKTRVSNKIIPPQFESMKEFINNQQQTGYYRYLWIDPGGKKSHGCAIAVCNETSERRFNVYEMIVVRAGLPIVAQEIAHLIMDWGVIRVGCEGNFDQAEVYAQTLNRELKRYMDDMDWHDSYIPIEPIRSKGEKMLRIRGKISHRIGIKGTEIKFFVNKNARSYDQFMTEITQFGGAVTDIEGFDLLDAVSSCDIHLVQSGGKFWWVSSETENNRNFM